MRSGQWRRWRSTATLAGILLVAAGCSGSSGTTDKAGAGAGQSSAGRSSSASARSSSSHPAKAQVKLAFGGDIHFADYLAPLATDPAGLAPLAGLWGDADLRMANLETAITERGTPEPKAFHFRAPASALTTLKGGGLTILTQANNHAVDYGLVGLGDTIEAKKASPVPIVGLGANEAEAFAPKLLDVAGLRVAVFGVDQVRDETTLPLHSASATQPGVASSDPPDRIASAVAAIRDTVDLVVVFVHWGDDYQSCPDGRSTATAQALATAGADIVVGAHSHRVNGAGWLGSTYVDYGLGNFVWWRSAEPDSRTGILTLTVDAAAARTTRPGARSAPVVTDAVWRPLLIGANGIPAAPAAADAARLLDLWEQARACTGLSGTP
jgi:hypothetical protein